MLTKVLEDAFTFFFSTEKLYAFSMHDFMQFLSSLALRQVGCELHCKELTANIIQYVVLTRLHLTKSLTRTRLYNGSAKTFEVKASEVEPTVKLGLTCTVLPLVLWTCATKAVMENI